MEDIIVPLIVFLFVGAIILGPKWLRNRERMRLIEVMKELSEKGATPSQPLVDALQADAWNEPRKPSPATLPERDLRSGATWIAVALAMLVLAALIGVDHRSGALPLMGCAAFPGFIGLARLGFWFASRGKRGL